MAVNIQLRRGTSAEWSASNPILTEGEVGVETDTKKLKVGDGLTVWASLPYITLTPAAAASLYAPIASPNFTGTVTLDTGVSLVFEGATANAFETTVQVADPTADRTLTLPDSTGTIATQEYATNAIGTHSSVTTSVHGIADTSALATKTYADAAVSTHSSDTTDVHGITDTSVLTTAGNTQTLTNKTLTSPKLNENVALTSTSTQLNYVNGVTSAIQTQLDAKAPLASPTFSGTVTLPTGAVTSTMIADATIVNGDISATAAIALSKLASGTSGQIIVANASGVPTWVSETGDITISDTGATAIASGVIVDGDVNASAAIAQSKIANLTTDLGLKAPLASPTFTGTPLSTTASVDTNTTQIATTAYVVGQGYAKLAGPTFTGTPTLPTGTIATTQTAGNSTTAVATTAFVTTADNLKANLAAPTFTGNVVLPSTTSIGNVDSTEIGYLDGVTSAIQTQLTARLPLAGGTMTGALTLSGAPTLALHAATKAYVDAAVEGLHVHPSVKAATTANIALATAVENGDTLDGVTLATGDRILVKNQTTTAENGIYVVAASGAPTRATDFDTAAEIDSGDFVFVDQGTTQANSGWVQINTPATIGTDAIEFVQFSGAGTYLAGSALTLIGSTFSIADSAITAAKIADGEITSAKIADGTIVNADINASAAIALSKLASGTSGQIIVANASGVPTWVSEAGDVTISDTGVTAIASGVIVDADINASAAIAQSKIYGLTTSLSEKAPLASPTFTGTVTLSASGIAFTDGTQTLEGVPSRTPIIQKTASYTLSALTERDDLIEMSSASAVTLSIPTDATLNFPIGTSIDVLQTGAGQVTIAAVTPGTTTVNATPGLKLRTTWSSATLFKRAANTWVVFGDLTA